MRLFVGFSRPKNAGLISRIIMKIQGTKYSHTYIKFYDKVAERDMVFEAVGNGVHFIEYKNWEKYETPVYEIPLNITSQQYQEFREFAADSCDVEYGIAVLIGIGIAKLLNLKRNPFYSKKRSYICSELVASVLKIFGYKFNKELELLDPKDISDLLLKK